MGSDRARETFNEARHYRRVIQQQGRVVLEADLNEAQQIAVESSRRSLIDLVGPQGVPWDSAAGKRGDGYRIHKLDLKTRDFHIGAGSMFVAGWNVLQPDASLTFLRQPDWLDRPPASSSGAQPKEELVYLRLREQEVSAVEDPALLEPALGGPDTAQRIRLVRRVERTATSARTLCDVEWGAGVALGTDGVSLTRTARLSVRFDSTAGSYLGAENQMIRVQGAAPAEESSDASTRLVWAWDNGSSLYRAEIADPKDLTTLKLLTLPVDVKHQPKVGQFVEVLTPAAKLGSEAFAVSTHGRLQQITRPYDPQTQTFGFATALPTSYTNATTLFVRIWENSFDITEASAGGAALVDSSGAAIGLRVALHEHANQTAIVAPGDYWHFAVRSSTPTSIYPARYSQPQPPEGPREWACPLAFIEWARHRVIDLRPSFSNLISATACCCRLTLGPPDLIETSLEDWIESLERCEEPVTICLRPGKYLLEKPIRLSKEHSHLTIEASGNGVVELAAAPHAAGDFRHGLLEVHETHDVTIRGLRFLLPVTTFEELITEELVEFFARMHAIEHIIFWQLRELRLSKGITLAHCGDVKIEKCDFTLPAQLEGEDDVPVFGACIFAAGGIQGLQVRDCEFHAAKKLKQDARHLLFGYLQVPPARDERELLREAKSERYEHVLMHPAREHFKTSLTEASFCGNSFRQLTAAALVMGNVGRFRIDGNCVGDCYGGFWLFALGKHPFKYDNLSYYTDFLAPVLSDRCFYWPLTLARCLPHPWLPHHRDEERPSFELKVRDNGIDAHSIALIAWHSDGDTGASAMVTDNRLSSRMRALPTGAVVNARYGVLVSNILLNYAGCEATAFVAAHGPGPRVFAASGNACEGTLRLP